MDTIEAVSAANNANAKIRDCRGYKDELDARDVLQEDIEFFNEANAFTHVRVRDADPEEYPPHIASRGARVFAEITLTKLVSSDPSLGPDFLFLQYCYVPVPAEDFEYLKSECLKWHYCGRFWGDNPTLVKRRWQRNRRPRDLDCDWRLNPSEGRVAGRISSRRRAAADIKLETASTLPETASSACGDRLPKDAIEIAQAAIADGQWMRDTRASDWAGRAVLKALNLDPGNGSHVTRVKRLLKDWTAAGFFKIVIGKDKHRHDKEFLEVGDRPYPGELISA